MKPVRALWHWMCRPVRQPGQWLLEQAHRPLAGIFPFAVLGAASYFGYYRPHWSWTALVVQGALALYVYLAGALAHGLWDRSRIWQDTICPTCDGGQFFCAVSTGPNLSRRRRDQSSLLLGLGAVCVLNGGDVGGEPHGRRQGRPRQGRSA
ncbi:hypothetical protein RB625_23225 [Streptomyces californicus]|uniref:hypothetical protein n=1 Tax=Streptomyces californicus TaxID=67351 RepID=UPI00296FCACC|nr:hypothetical protein [Streptomyces californicus]MDW4901328.1 hypothetical protein [Streptomyces californicus]